MEKRISGRTVLLCLLGTPVGHSGSPLMYNFSFAHDGLDFVYTAFDINVDQMPAALEAVKLLKMRGCNVTMPCKSIAAQLVDDLSPAARIIGAVNTIVNDDGKLTGHITDGIGFVRSLQEEGVEVKDKKIVVLGAGGAATAIQVQCALDGAKEISIFNRDDEFMERAHGTCEKLKKETPECAVNVYPLEDAAKLASAIAAADILINATIIGMKPNDGKSLVDKSLLRKDLVVCDAVYNPEKTALIMDAEEVGCAKAVGGKGMLLWQGAAAYKLYTNIDMPVNDYKKFQEEQAAK